MSQVNAQTLAFIRRATRQFLNETCTIENRTGSRNAIGVAEETFSVVALDVPCRVIMERGNSANVATPVASREAMVDGYRIVLPAGTTIGHDYRVTVGVAVYDVKGILDDRTDENDVQVRAVKVR